MRLAAYLMVLAMLGLAVLAGAALCSHELD